MKLLSRALLAAAVAVAGLSFCGSAGAANVTVGPSLIGGWVSEPCGIEACSVLNADLGGTGTNLRSPVNGAIVGWSLVGGSTAGTYRLGTALQFSKSGFTFRKWSNPVASSPMEGVQSFSTVLPVERGMLITLTMSETASLGFREGVGQLAEWEFEPAESENSLEDELFAELAGFNAEIQPAPTITSLGTASGPTSGGTAVTITGTDLENVSAVTFGSTPAASVTVGSESQITAVAPASAAAAAVSVSVTTVAGKAVAPQTFKYEVPPAPAPILTPPPPAAHCVVPKLTGKKLTAAKKALTTAKCKLGTVKKLAGATAGTGKVSKQAAKPGSQLAVGAKVSVTLKPSKPAAKGHGK
ncbi:MAG TPA: IPT/TIG domain-containing protein [Solirubrobacterales bacterium]|jgi:hypothetical protein